MTWNNICIMGHARAGKTTVGRMLADRRNIERPVDISDILIAELAEDSGIDETHIVACKELLREKLYWLGRGFERTDPLRLVRRALQISPICCGVRTADELEACVEQNVFDAYLWVDRAGTTAEPGTLTYHAADQLAPKLLVLDNNGGLEGLREHLKWSLEGSVVNV